jgi:hypothetical protein
MRANAFLLYTRRVTFKTIIMGYYINLSSISIDSYRAKLESSDLLPSRMILRDKLDERFNYLKSIGISNVFELQQTLKKKNKFEELANVSCLSDDYLTILLREINSIQPKPNKIKEFSGIAPVTISKLEQLEIKDTLALFDKVTTPKSRKELAAKTGIDELEILELTKLTDLSRIKWVGATFARMLYDMGIDTVEKASKANFAELHKMINQINKERNYFKGQIGLNDMKLFVSAAKEISLEIEY